MKALRIVLTLLIVYLSFSVHSYEVPTHQELSSHSVDLSNLSTDFSLLNDLGLQSFNREQTFNNPDEPNGNNITIKGLFRNGSKFEDNFPRFVNHFYDPVYDRGLWDVPSFFDKSPDWILEDLGDMSGQDNSYKDAMNFFYLALTSQTEQVRDDNWGIVFQSLGQVIHHIQDMSQPQHVRNDQHLTGINSSWYEKYTLKLHTEVNDSTFASLMSEWSDFNKR